MYVSLLLKNIGTASREFNINQLRYSVTVWKDGSYTTIDKNLPLYNLNESFSPNETTTYNIDVGSEQRLFLKLGGFYCPQGKDVTCIFYLNGQNNSIGTFKFRAPSA